MIDYLHQNVLYENPLPMLRSRHGFFPGVVQLPSGELLTLFALGEAFESVDLTTYVARSSDEGKNWQLQGPLYDKSADKIPTSDFLKPQILSDGRILALGYRFHRIDPELPIAIQETDGILPGDNIVSFSQDDGHSWTVPQVISRRTPELIEIPSRALQLTNGDIVATGGVFKLPDGSNPSGQFGVLWRSKDLGATWDDGTHFFRDLSGTISSYESHICEMQPGRLVIILWALDVFTGKRYPNQVVVSHDYGTTWSSPIDTGIMGEAANLLYLGGERIMSIHCHRGDELGLYVRVIDFTNDQWKVEEEKLIWGLNSWNQSHESQKFHEVARSLRFGQASLLKLASGDILATHWCIIDGLGKIITHRLRYKDNEQAARTQRASVSCSMEEELS